MSIHKTVVMIACLCREAVRWLCRLALHHQMPERAPSSETWVQEVGKVNVLFSCRKKNSLNKLKMLREP